MEKLFVVPLNDAIVRFPEPPHNALPKKGAKVPNNSFWRRRVADKDVMLVTEDLPAKKPPPPPPPPPADRAVREDGEKVEVPDAVKKTVKKSVKKNKDENK